MQGVSKGYDGLELLKNLDLDIPAGAIVGVIGPNGIGKTTLFRMIVGEETQDSGTIEIKFEELVPKMIINFQEKELK
jgi:ABC-type multidrug transport system ATPase subunit